MIRNSQPLTLIFTYGIALLLSLGCTSRPGSGLDLNLPNWGQSGQGSNFGTYGNGNGNEGPFDSKSPLQKENLGNKLDILKQSTGTLKDKLGTENCNKLMNLIETYKSAYDKQYEALETQNAELLEQYEDLAEEAAEEAEEIATSIETISGLETLAAAYHEMANKHDVHLFGHDAMYFYEVPMGSLAEGHAAELLATGWTYWGVVYRLYKKVIHPVKCAQPIYICGGYNATAPALDSEGNAVGYHYGWWNAANSCDMGGQNALGSGEPIGYACAQPNEFSVQEPILRFNHGFVFDVGDDQCSEENAENNTDCNANLYHNFDANGDGVFDLYVYSSVSVVDSTSISISKSRGYKNDKVLGYSVP